jgi:RNA recognition motif-containing protein
MGNGNKLIFISNIDPSVNRNEFIQSFSEYGKMDSCSLFFNEDGKCRGFAIISFPSKETYLEVLKSKIFLKSKLLSIEPYLSNKTDLTAKD